LSQHQLKFVMLGSGSVSVASEESSSESVMVHHIKSQQDTGSSDVNVARATTGATSTSSTTNSSTTESDASTSKHTDVQSTKLNDSHITEVLRVSRAAERKTIRCRFFFSAKGCANGDSCKFSHEIPENSNSHPVSESVIPTESHLQAQPDNFKPIRDCTVKEGEKSFASPQKKEKIRPNCRFYAAGFCKWGDR